MRGLRRTFRPEEEEESVFVTMTDMTVSFLLIIMILLAFFATQITNETTIPLSIHEAVRAERDELREQLERLQEANPLEVYLAKAIEQQYELLVELRDRLKVEFPDLQVVVSPDQDALRFQGEGLFESGSSSLQPHQYNIVETMGEILDEILTCFTLGERASRGPECKSGNALIEAVQIEGHTDSDGSDESNLKLSTDRANETFLVMLNTRRSILEHKNWSDQPVMSVAGYGEMRPIASNATKEGKAENRRIDLRIIMYAPSTVKEVEEISQRLEDLRSGQ